MTRGTSYNISESLMGCRGEPAGGLEFLLHLRAATENLAERSQELQEQVLPRCVLDAFVSDVLQGGPQPVAWSISSLEHGSLALRIGPAPGGAYVAHGLRCGWDAGLVLGADGSLIGDETSRSSGVVQPASGESPQPPEQPLGLAEARRSPAFVLALVANLLQAFLSDELLVMGLPVEAFGQGASLPLQLCFARACLPVSLRRACDLRLFTRRPTSHSSSVRFMAVPEDSVSELLASGRSTVFLDASGGRLSGASIADSVWELARALTKRALQLPEGLLAFGRQCDGLFPTFSEPSPALIASVPMLYNAAYAVENPRYIGDLLLSYVVPGLGNAQLLPISVVLPPRPAPFWPLVPAGILRELALSEQLPMPAAFSSDDGGQRQQLRRLLETELVARGDSLDAELASTGEWSLGRLEILAGLLERGLVSASAAASVSTASTLGMLPLGAPLHGILRAEASTVDGVGKPLLTRRSDEAGTLATVVKAEQAHGVFGLPELLIEFSCGGSLSFDWLRQLLASPELSDGLLTALIFGCALARGIDLKPLDGDPEERERLADAVLGAFEDTLHRAGVLDKDAPRPHGAEHLQWRAGKDDLLAMLRSARHRRLCVDPAFR
jgi:hypothetical protein